MTLEDYLDRNKLTNREFAQQIGVHECTVSHYIRKRRRPEWRILEKIYEATNGNVTPKDFMDI